MHRALRFVGLLSVALFCALLGVSMFLYPGGTWTDVHTTSYRFFENFFCDLTHHAGLNGLPNSGAPFAKAALVSMAPALGLFYVALARDLTALAPRGHPLVFVLGILAALGLLFVPMTPSDRYPILHSIASLSASGAGILALVTVLAVSWRRKGVFLPALVLALVAATDSALYVQQLRTNGPTPLLLPALQKVAAMWLVGWMIVLFGRDPSRLLKEQPASLSRSRRSVKNTDNSSV